MYENNYNDILDAQNGDREILEKIVKNNMKLVYSIVKRFQDRGIEAEDLNQIGTIGLIKAIKKFDISYNVKLSTYSVPYIIGEIKRYIRDDGTIKISRSIKELGARINQTKKEFNFKFNKDITVDELSKLLKTSKEEIIFALEANSNNLISMYEPVDR